MKDPQPHQLANAILASRHFFGPAAGQLDLVRALTQPRDIAKALSAPVESRSSDRPAGSGGAATERSCHAHVQLA